MRVYDHNMHELRKTVKNAFEDEKFAETWDQVFEEGELEAYFKSRTKSRVHGKRYRHNDDALRIPKR
jgi:hypothetical protein